MQVLDKVKKLIEPENFGKTLIRFYAVGLVLFFLPFTRELFFAITPLTILLVGAAAFAAHNVWNKRVIFLFAFIAISSFCVEAVGTGTGKIFGNYWYDTTLGIKWLATPLLIGINWLYLIYATRCIAATYTRKPLLLMVAGSALMVIYDLVLEVVAPPMKMWRFDTTYPPFVNFVMWFILSFAYHGLMQWVGVFTNNKSARALYWVQLGFFFIIAIYSLLFLK